MDDPLFPPIASEGNANPYIPLFYEVGEEDQSLLDKITALNMIDIMTIFNNTVYSPPFLVLFDYKEITEKELV